MVSAKFTEMIKKYKQNPRDPRFAAPRRSSLKVTSSIEGESTTSLLVTDVMRPKHKPRSARAKKVNFGAVVQSRTYIFEY